MRRNTVIACMLAALVAGVMLGHHAPHAPGKTGITIRDFVMWSDGAPSKHARFVGTAADLQWAVDATPSHGTLYLAGIQLDMDRTVAVRPINIDGEEALFVWSVPECTDAAMLWIDGDGDMCVES